MTRVCMLRRDALGKHALKLAGFFAILMVESYIKCVHRTILSPESHALVSEVL